MTTTIDIIRELACLIDDHKLTESAINDLIAELPMRSSIAAATATLLQTLADSSLTPSRADAMIKS